MKVRVKRERARIVDRVMAGGRLPGFTEFTGLDYDASVKGAQRQVRCDYFDALKASGRWQQGDEVPRMKRDTGAEGQRQSGRRATWDKRRAKARIGDRYGNT
jgi:hypothetical protein